MTSSDRYMQLSAEVRISAATLKANSYAKFQYIRDIQGDVLDDPDTLTRVVNADGSVIGELVETVAVFGEAIALMLEAQSQIIKRLGQ